MYKIVWTTDKAFYAFWGGLVSLFVDIRSALLGLFICIMVDTVTGFWAAPHRGKTRNSHDLSRFVTKIITYSLAVIVMHVLESYVFPDYAVNLRIQLARVACSVFCWLEIYSTLENLYDITGLEAFKCITQVSLTKVKEAIGVDPKQGETK